MKQICYLRVLDINVKLYQSTFLLKSLHNYGQRVMRNYCHSVIKLLSMENIVFQSLDLNAQHLNATNLLSKAKPNVSECVVLSFANEYEIPHYDN